MKLCHHLPPSTCQMCSCEFCKVSNNTYSCRTPPVTVSECSRNLEFETWTDQNVIIQNLHHTKEYYISKKKTLLKHCQKEVIYEYILALVALWSIFSEVIRSGGYILSILGWNMNFLRMSFKVTGGLPWSSFNFKLFVILMKNLFIMEASCFSSETSSPFSLSSILFEFNPLLLKYGLFAFQNFLLSDKSFTFRFWKYSVLVLQSSVTQKFCCFS